MRKFTESIENEHDNDFSAESVQDKLRNKLGAFWTLSKLISDKDNFEKLLSTESGKEIIIKTAKQCELDKDRILELIEMTEK